MARFIGNRLYLSGMDSRAAALARQWRVGYEVTAFSYAPVLDDEQTVHRVRQETADIDRLWFHAPFAELIPCAIDPLARQVAQKRLLQAAETAISLGIRRMVCHGGFIPRVYFPQWYVSQSVPFWKELLEKLPPDFTLALENVMEPTPETLVTIASQVGDPRLGLCLDVGHGNTCVSALPPVEWVASMAPYLRHVHLHNNDGVEDLHQPLGQGVIPMETVLDAILTAAPEATLTIENQDCLPSLRWLAERGYIEEPT